MALGRMGLYGLLLAIGVLFAPAGALAQSCQTAPAGSNDTSCANTSWVTSNFTGSALGASGTVVDARQYGAVSGVFRVDGQINGGCSTAANILCTPSGNYQKLGVQAGWYAIVFGAGTGAGTLAGGKITSVSTKTVTLSNGASTPIASGAAYVLAPDSGPALTLAANNPLGAAVHIPAGIYCVATQILQAPSGQRGTPSNLGLVTLYGDGPAQTELFACQPMTTSGTNEAVFYRNSAFAHGGGLENMTVDAIGLAQKGVFWAGGGDALLFNVFAENATVADWQCGDGTHQAAGNRFIAIRGDTNSNIFSAAQEAQYNFWTHTSGCTDTWIVDSTFSNASVRNIFDDGPSQGNHYVNDHPFNTAGYTPPYSIEIDGMGIVAGNEMDGGGTIAGIYVNGNNAVVTGNYEFINGGWTAGDMILIATGANNVVVTGNTVRFVDSMPAANVVVQAGSAGSGTVVADNGLASYSYPGVTCAAGSPSSSFATSGGVVTHC